MGRPSILMESSFIKMWQEADIEDASIGGVDSIPEWEYPDYIEAFLMNVGGSIREHKEQLNISSIVRPRR